MEEGIEQKEMHPNQTTPHISPPTPKPGFRGYYALIPFAIVVLTGCALAVIVYIRRKLRSEALRHRLIPLYSYDASDEQEDWGNADREDEELTEPLYKEGKLFFSSVYGT